VRGVGVVAFQLVPMWPDLLSYNAVGGAHQCPPGRCLCAAQGVS
jgi:hypothetical protein